MMHKNRFNRWMMTKAIVLPALMALAVVAFAKPKVEEIPATENENILPADDKVADNSEDALVKLLDDGKTFIVNIPDGTLIENRVCFQNNPNRNSARIPGLTNPVYSWMYWNICPTLPSNGAIRQAMMRKSPAEICPTNTRLTSLPVFSFTFGAI